MDIRLAREVTQLGIASSQPKREVFIKLLELALNDPPVIPESTLGIVHPFRSEYVRHTFKIQLPDGIMLAIDELVKLKNYTWSCLFEILLKRGLEIVRAEEAL